MSRRVHIKDGVYLAVLPDGTVAGGVLSSNPHPKVYTTLNAAKKRIKDGGIVLHVTSDRVVEVFSKVVPKTFFLNERHELTPYGPGGGDDDR